MVHRRGLTGRLFFQTLDRYPRAVHAFDRDLITIMHGSGPEADR